MDSTVRIKMIEDDVRKSEIVIEQVIEIVKPELKDPAECCFGIFNICIDWFLNWYYIID